MTIKKYLKLIPGVGFIILSIYYFNLAHNTFHLKNVAMFLLGISSVVYGIYLNGKNQQRSDL
jgi:hypothetical protein